MKLFKTFCLSLFIATQVITIDTPGKNPIDQEDNEVRALLQTKNEYAPTFLKDYGLNKSTKLRFGVDPSMLVWDRKNNLLYIPQAYLKTSPEEEDGVVREMLKEKGIDCQAILEKMGLKNEQVLFGVQLLGATCASKSADKRYIKLDDDSLERTTQELLFVIGHECAHLTQNNRGNITAAKKQIIRCLLLTPLLTLACGYVANQLGNTSSKKMLRTIGGASCGLFTGSLCSIFACKKLLSLYHNDELDADREAALKLNCTQGAITYFENTLAKNKELLRNYPTIASRYLYKDGEAKKDFEHPDLAERIKHIKELQAKTA